MEDRIYYRELKNYRSPPKGSKDMGHLYYDLTLLPSQKMREEYRLFLTEMGQEKTIQTIDHDKSLYHHLCRFIKSQRKQPESFHTWERTHG